MLPGVNITLDEYKEVVSNPNSVKNQEVLANKLNLNEFIEKLKDNNLCEVVRNENGPN